ncbi:tetratricopeptide repeat protein [Modestobacter sp. I12A-02662]|uniref:tetratricopeptide repeat protein n=1 Tax=Modestobacter sp. I12A-02662 TaxID=1730496 RepID=UPI0034DECA02
MDLITSSVAGALAQATLSAMSARARTSLGGEFEPEIRQILTGVQRMRQWLAEDRQALLQDGFSFILQDDLDAARRSLTQAKNREPRSAVVRYWLSLVLAVQGRAGAETEMREAMELNPYLASPAAARPGDSRPGPPEGQRPVWVQRLTGREAGVTLGAVGASFWTSPGRWIAGRVARRASERLEHRLFSGAHLDFRKSSSIATISLGTGNALAAWAFQPLGNPESVGYVQRLGLLSMFETESGHLLWHRIWDTVDRPLFATPRMIVQRRGDQYGLYAPATGMLLEILPATYVETLIVPPYVWESEGYAAAHATTKHMDLAWPEHVTTVVRRPPQRVPRRSPFAEWFTVQPPTVAWPAVSEAAHSRRLFLTAVNEYRMIGKRVNDPILCRSGILLFDTAASPQAEPVWNPATLPSQQSN